MIYQCSGCLNKLAYAQTEVETGVGRFHPPCGDQGKCYPFAVESADDLETWRWRVESRSARLVRLLQLSAPDIIIAEERRMLLEAARGLCLFEPIPEPQGGVA